MLIKHVREWDVKTSTGLIRVARLCEAGVFVFVFVFVFVLVAA